MYLKKKKASIKYLKIIIDYYRLIKMIVWFGNKYLKTLYTWNTCTYITTFMNIYCIKCIFENYNSMRIHSINRLKIH